MSRGRVRLVVASALTAALVVTLGVMWKRSLLPDSYDMASMGYVDWGGGNHGGHAMGGMDMNHMNMGETRVVDLVADPHRRADVVKTLTARQDGDRITVNGTTPGPELRVTQGQLVEVHLVNDNVRDGITLHWHGVDVPNAEDGVAGVTQDAVPPGGRFTYRFVADQPGTYWYHSHQLSHLQVRQGLFGALVVEPKAAAPQVLDQVAVLHEYDEPTLNGSTKTRLVDARVGQKVRLRVVNTDNGLTSAWVTGTPYELLATDGRDVHGPTPITGKAANVTAGGRIDLGFTVPAGGVRVDLGGTNAIEFGRHVKPGPQPESFVDILHYGTPAPLGFDPTHPDRRFDYRIGRRLGFLDGKPGRWWTINGHLFPDVPMFMVDEGDVVVFHIINKSGDSHPMHLHGHHAVVLSRNGKPATGSPWWVDSLDVEPGSRYDIAFVADNPGIWMDHCHNLPHATQGLVAHLMYTGVRSSFRIGGKDANEPE